MLSKKGHGSRYDKFGYFFIAPFFLTFLGFQLYPILNTFFLSLTDARGLNNPVVHFIWFTNFVKLVQDQFFWKAFTNTWIIWLLNFIPQMLVAFFLAVIMTDARLKLKGVGVFKAIFYMPNLLTAASVAVLYATLFAWPNGPLNQALVTYGVLPASINFYRDPWLTRSIVAFIQFWMWYGSTVILLCAGITGISPSLYESAVVDGANGRQTFFHITLPLLKPIVLYILVTSLIGGMQMFDIPFLITNGRGDPAGSIMTSAVYLYNHAFLGSNNYSYASTISVGLFIITGVLALILFFLMRDTDQNAKTKKGAL